MFKKILLTHPGRLGDLLYTLPIVRSIRKNFSCVFDYEIPEYCKPAIFLLKKQKLFRQILIDESVDGFSNEGRIRYANLKELKHYDHIFHLGLDSRFIGHPHKFPHLIEAYYAIMKKRYGIDLKISYNNIYIKLRRMKRKNYISFNGYGHSAMSHLRHMNKIPKELINKFNKIFDMLGKPVIAITGPDEVNHYKDYNCEVLVPDNLYIAAEVIKMSKLFIGVESCPYVIADGMKHPLAVLNFIKSVKPTGLNGHAFTLMDKEVDIVEKIKKYL